VLDKIGGKSRAPAFTFGGGKDDIGLKAEKDFLGGPGPGAYHIDEILAVAAERKRIEKGFSFGERVGAAWHEAGPGKDAPAPGTYDEDVRRSGTHGGFSFGNDLRFAPSSKDKDGPTPGPGDYLDKDNKKDGNDKENKMRKSVEGLSGFTFGWRRPESAKKSAEPGPGAYHRDAIVDDPDALRPGPAFSLGTKLTTNVSGVNKDASKMPGPGDYEVQPRGSSDHAGPSYTIPGRPNDGVVAGVDLKDKASMPGPGRYHTPLSPGGRAYTLGPRIETKDGKKDFPAPGEYGAPMQPGSKFGDGKRGFSVLGRDAWVGSGWGEEHAEVPGVGRYEVRGSNSNPLPSAPAFTMASKTKNQDQASNDIGPGEYDGDGSKPPSGPSFTIGVRGSKDGAYGDLEKAAEKPGPGAYPNAAKAKDETRESAPSFSLGVKTTVVDDRTRVGPGGIPTFRAPGSTTGNTTSSPTRTARAGSQSTNEPNR
jgi:collagen type III alpha